MSARIVPLCQIEDCAKPLMASSERVYLMVKDRSDWQWRQIVVCRDCAKRMNAEAEQPRAKA